MTTRCKSPTGEGRTCGTPTTEIVVHPAPYNGIPSPSVTIARCPKCDACKLCNLLRCKCGKAA